MKKRLLTGLQPTGNLTIGNYCGSIMQMLKYQKDYETFLFVPDLHSITVKQDPETLHRRIHEIVGVYLACGILPEQNKIYIQSENLYHTNLSWILECHSYTGELSRMTQFKAKSQSKSEKEISCGLFTYPILMASDILLYSADCVPTGADQKQHVELARTIARRFNARYGDTFVVPEPLIPQVGAKIRDLVDPTLKMSKSTENPKASIFLMDNEKDIRKKIMSAKTDSDGIIRYDEVEKPGVSNLLTIYAAFTGCTVEEAVVKFDGGGYGDLKRGVADVVVEALTGIQDRYQKALTDGKIDEVLDAGRDFTMEIAREKYEQVRRLVGLGR